MQEHQEHEVPMLGMVLAALIVSLPIAVMVFFITWSFIYFLITYTVVGTAALGLVIIHLLNHKRR